MDRTLLKLRLADLFCGAGGTSTGACEAVRAAGFEPVLTAVNHWPTAIATHQSNHREATHLCASVDDVDPRKLYRLGELDLLWASPECTHHSRARGGKPMHDQSRATGHCVTRWAEALQPPVILVENVPEFVDWGPLGTDGKPLKSRKGDTFKAWVAMLESLGYRVEWRILCAADYGDPTTRRRLFVQAVRGRRQIVWPHRTHAPLAELQRPTEPDLFSSLSASGGEGRGEVALRPWRSARECIDWSHKGRWLDEMPAKKPYNGLPLSPKTLRRIHAGLRKYGLKGHIIPAQTGADRTRSLDVPLQTVTTESRGIGLVEPYVVSWDHQSGSGLKGADEPLTSVTTKARHGVVEPFMVELRGTESNQLDRSAKSVDNPLGAVTAGGGHHGLLEPHVIPLSLRQTRGEGRGEGCVPAPFLVPTGFGERPDQQPRTHSLDAPMPTVVGAGKQALIEPHLLGQHSCSALRPVSEPSPTVTCGGAIALVEPHLVPLSASGGEGRGEVAALEPHLVKFYGTATAANIAEPLDTVTTKERFGLVEAELIELTRALPHLAGRSAAVLDQILPRVTVNGRTYRIRLRWRMLQPGELSLAQGFPREYRFTGTKTDAVKQIGNAVPRHLARALVFAALTQNPDVSALWN